ncbi:hypothetical protein MD484_g1310, partial [Candolleomyces efflorescens]
MVSSTRSSGTPRAQRKKAPPPSSPRKKAKKPVKPRTKTGTTNEQATSSGGNTASPPPSLPTSSGLPAGGALPPVTAAQPLAPPPTGLMGHPSAAVPFFAGHPGAFHALAAQMAMAGGSALPSGFNSNPRFFAHQPQFGPSINDVRSNGPAGSVLGYPYSFPIDPALLGYPPSAHPPAVVTESPANPYPSNGTTGVVHGDRLPPVHEAEEEEEEPEDGANEQEGRGQESPTSQDIQSSSETAPITPREDDDVDMGDEGQSGGEGELESQGPGDQTTLVKEKKKRVYPSDSNPTKGLIKGVGRGDHPVEMARKRGLKPIPLCQKSASRIFSDISREIMTRSEDLSNRTGSWIYVAMHHPGATLPFVHFASRRLRKEVPDELAKVHQEVSHMMKLLTRGSRTHSLDNVREKEEALRIAAEATRQAEEAVERARQADERARRAESVAEGYKRDLDANRRVMSTLVSD